MTAVPVTKVAQKRADKREALERLRELCPPGTTIWTVLRSVSRSGMTRGIDCYVFQYGPTNPRASTRTERMGVTKLWLSRYMSRAGIAPWDNKRECLKVEGGGMDMGYHLIHNLSYALHGMEDVGLPEERHPRVEDPAPTAYRAGYSLLHEWI